LLHVTNGDFAVAVLSRAVPGTLLPWRDVLHEGPVHAGLPLAALSRRRAQFIASTGWGVQKDIEAGFAERDSVLQTAGEHEEVVLWFEHDLYDQLQLIQLLDWFGTHPHPRLSLVCEAEYLGDMTPARAAELFRFRKNISSEQLREGTAAWAAFGGPDPRRIRVDPVPSLPFLGPALCRLLEEFPWTTDGLSRLERQVLDALAGGPLPFAQLFPRAHHHREDPVFLGDTVLAWHLERMRFEGLVEQQNEFWASTGEPRRTRRPRWIGGYEIRDERLCWDPASGAIRSRSGAQGR
jgi:hypothetical protein